jgi:hypothetical protein
MWHIWGREEMQTGFLWGNVKGQGQLEQTRHRWEDNIKMGTK